MSQHNPDIRHISWARFTEVMDDLSERIIIHSETSPINKILYLARGGMVPAAMLAHSLGVTTVKQMEFGAQFDFFDDDVLIVDDILDTGHTLARGYLHELQYNFAGSNFDEINAYFAFPYIRANPRTSLDIYPDETERFNATRKFIVDRSFYSVEERSDDWLVFPWERDGIDPRPTPSPYSRIIGEV